MENSIEITCSPSYGRSVMETVIEFGSRKSVLITQSQEEVVLPSYVVLIW